jgi:DNA mismatch repair protein MutS2
MLFDTGKIKPLFRLEIGKPGSSFAVDIARQIGLPEEILHAATEKAGGDHVRFDKFLREILRDKKYWKDKREQVRTSERKLVSLLVHYQEEIDQIKALKKEVLDKARGEAEELLANANREIENTIRVIRETQADKEKTKAARNSLSGYRNTSLQRNAEPDDILQKKRRAVEKRRKQYDPDMAENTADAEIPDPDDIKKGDIIRLPDRQSTGEVIEVSGDNLVVALGESMITNLKKSAVQVLNLSEQEAYRTDHPVLSRSHNLNERRLRFSNEIDIRGERGNDAVEIVKHFIDDAAVVGVSELRILHGKGNGILKHLIREYLGSLDIVRSYGDEHEDHGGSGITVVNLDF